MAAIKERASEKYPKSQKAVYTARQGVFISYSHLDKKWLDMLLTMLKPLFRSTDMFLLADTSILRGSIWREDAMRAIDRALVVVLLVTPDFLASDFIHEHELPPLLKAAAEGGAKILWVPVRASSYKHTPLNNYQAVLDPSRPLASMSAAERDQALVRIGEMIAKLSKPE
jgi:internalin A